jgi:hypothetical protein
MGKFHNIIKLFGCIIWDWVAGEHIPYPHLLVVGSSE